MQVPKIQLMKNTDSKLRLKKPLVVAMWCVFTLIAQTSLQFMVERLFVERLFTYGQLIEGHYVKVSLHEVYKILH